MIQKPAELVRFISGVNIDSEGTVHLDQLDVDDTFESELYSPTFSVSVMSRMVLDEINKTVELLDMPVEKDSFIGLVLASDLQDYSPYIYLLTKIVALECYSVVYCIDEDRNKLRYVTKKDVHRIKENINYLADYMGTEDKYYKVVESLRDMYIALGYVENQLDVIINDREVR